MLERALLTIPALAVPLLLSTCGDGLDVARAATCRRALPALAPPGAAVTVLRVGRSSGPAVIRVDYRVEGRPDAKARWIACSFGIGAEITGIASESGPVGGASLYLLKRYYLDTPDAAQADPTEK